MHSELRCFNDICTGSEEHKENDEVTVYDYAVDVVTEDAALSRVIVWEIVHCQNHVSDISRG
jgi:hypothetical protein